VGSGSWAARASSSTFPIHHIDHPPPQPFLPVRFFDEVTPIGVLPAAFGAGEPPTGDRQAARQRVKNRREKIRRMEWTPKR